MQRWRRCNGAAKRKKKKKNPPPPKTKDRDGPPLPFTSNKSVPSFSKGPDYASAYPKCSNKDGVCRVGFSGPSPGSPGNVTSLNQQRGPTFTRFTFIAGHFPLGWNVFGSQTAHTHNTSLAKTIVRKRTVNISIDDQMSLLTLNGSWTTVGHLGHNKAS